MKKIVLLFSTLLCCVFSNAQKEASNWYFGDNSGIRFDIDAGTVTATSGSLSTEEGCTSISNSIGELLFYTDGRVVYDSNGAIMSNGTGLKGDQSSTQSAIIIPKPNNPGILGDPSTYYIFTVDTAAIDGTDFGFHFYEVNMLANGGLGEVVTNSETQLLQNTSEKLSAVLESCETGNIWVITFANANGISEANNRFFAYRVTNTGVNTAPVISPSGLNTTEIRGYLKFSPNGEKLVSANAGNGLYLYDFDKLTGSVSNPQLININFNSPSGEQQFSYGVEFSPNSELLYVSTYFSSNGINNTSGQYGGLLQYNLSAGNISSTQVIIDERQTYRGGLQLGPDGRIYRAMSNNYSDGNLFLSVVNNPNAIGMACNYQHAVVPLTNRSRQGLPPFITSFFSESTDIIQNGTSTTNLDLCDGDTYTLLAEDISGATYTWTKNGSPLPDNDFDLIVNSTTGSGEYEVVIELNNGNCGVIEGKAIVAFSQVPVANTPADLTACSDLPDTNIATFEFLEQTPVILGPQSDMQFNVNYFRSQLNAEENRNSIDGDFQNTANPQPIFARIENVDNPNCFDITEFNVLVYTTPEVSTTDDFILCDYDSDGADGRTTVTLSNFNAEVLGTQNATLYTISYYSTQTDADSGRNEHPDNYVNTTPFTEPLFIRIENNNDNSCYSTKGINLIINAVPEANDTDLYQCDEDGTVNGRTTFNLTEANHAITGSASNVTTQFFVSNVDAIANENAVDANAFNNTENPQIVYVRVTDEATGCFSFSELILETSTTQISDYHAPEVCDELDSEDGKNTFNLDDFSVSILSGLPAGLSISYYLTETDALLENNPLISPYQNTSAYSQTIYVRVENNNACYGINKVFLTINPRPDLGGDDTVLYCLNDFPSNVTLDSGLNDTSVNYSFSWSSGQNTESIAINSVGTYTVTVTNNATSCDKVRTLTVEPSNIATIENIKVVDGGLKNNVITILTSGEGVYEYALTDQEGITTPFQESNIFTQVTPGIYTASIRDVKNDCGIVEENVSVIGFPLYFTPNGDSINDTWQVYGVSSQFQPNSKILIFNRFGKLVSQLKPSSSGWDGTLNGKPLPQSDYWFSVTLQDGRVYKNHFTLKR